MDLQLGLVPVHDDDATRQAIDEVALALSSALGRGVRVHRAVSPSALGLAFEAGIVELVWSSPTLALSKREMRCSVPVVVCQRQGVAHYHGVIFVRRDSSIRSALDLTHRSIGWVARTSAAGYIFPRVSLAGHGLDPSALFSSETFLDTHGGVVLSVLEGAVDAGATFAVFERGDASAPMVRAGFVDLGREDEVRVVLSTPPIPSDLFVASPRLHAELGEGLVAALRWVCREHPSAFHLVFGADDLVPALAKPLAELRRQLDDARAMGVLD